MDESRAQKKHDDPVVYSPNPGFSRNAFFFFFFIRSTDFPVFQAPLKRARSATLPASSYFQVKQRTNPRRRWVLPLPQPQHKSPSPGLSTRSRHVLSRVAWGVGPDGLAFLGPKPRRCWKR